MLENLAWAKVTEFKVGQLVKFKADSFYSLCEGRILSRELTPNGYEYTLRNMECNGVMRLDETLKVEEYEIEIVK